MLWFVLTCFDSVSSQSCSSDLVVCFGIEVQTQKQIIFAYGVSNGFIFVQATLEETVAERPHPLGGSRRFRVDEMEDFDDIPWWIRNTETRGTPCEGSQYPSDICDWKCRSALRVCFMWILPTHTGVKFKVFQSRNALVPTVDPATDAFSASATSLQNSKLLSARVCCASKPTSCCRNGLPVYHCREGTPLIWPGFGYRVFFRSRLWIISQYSLEHCFFRLGSIFVHPQLRARSVCSLCSACMCGLHGLTGAERGCRRSCLKLKTEKKRGIDYTPGWSNETRACSDTVLEYLTVFL